MSTDQHGSESIGDDLQFDHAEYASDAHSGQPDSTICSICKTPIKEVYFEAGGQILCDSCRDRIEGALQGDSRLGRFFKAAFFGTIAAAAGACLYYAIMRITGINLGLVAVVVGVMVGGAVRSGSGYRGGWFYQLLAVFLTYSSIVAMFAVPGFIEAFQADRDPGAIQAEQKNVIKPANGEAKAPTPEKAEAPRRKEAEAPAREPEADVPLQPWTAALYVAVFLMFVVVFSYTIPVQIALESPISGLIFGFALWEAWKINRRTPVVINGPFRLAASTAEALQQEAGSDGHGV